MSKLFDSLKKYNDDNGNGNGKYPEAFKNGPARDADKEAIKEAVKEEKSVASSSLPVIRYPRRETTWVTRFLLLIAISAIFGLGAMLFLMIKSYEFDSGTTSKTLDNLENMLNKNIKQISSLSDEIKRTNTDLRTLGLQLETTNSKIGSIVMELNRSGEILTRGMNQVNSVSGNLTKLKTDLENTDIKIKDQGEAIAQLKQSYSSQKETINSLVTSNNALVDKLQDLEQGATGSSSSYKR
jgi:septal ring factor EnvC (AmiA/AmiB activator)